MRTDSGHLSGELIAAPDRRRGDGQRRAARFRISVRLIALAFSGVVAAALLYPMAAAAQSCNATLGTMNFGAINVLLNAPFYTAETVSVSCSGYGANQTVLVCLGEGWTGGSCGGGDLNNGRWISTSTCSNNLTEVTYQDAGYTTIWGSPWDTSSDAVVYQLVATTNSSGNATASFTGYGKIGAGYTTYPPGAYTGASTDVRVLSHVKSGTSDTCSAIPPSNYTSGVKTLTGTLSATIPPTCNVSATPLNFGTSGTSIAANIRATATITAQCTYTTPYSVGLDNGQNANGAQRRMQAAAGQYVSYGLYTDTGYSQAWTTTSSTTSCSAGANTCALGTGTGSNQSVTVYGEVPPQSAPAAGTYSDTVVVTVTF